MPPKYPDRFPHELFLSLVSRVQEGTDTTLSYERHSDAFNLRANFSKWRKLQETTSLDPRQRRALNDVYIAISYDKARVKQNLPSPATVIIKSRSRSGPYGPLERELKLPGTLPHPPEEIETSTEEPFDIISSYENMKDK